MSPVPAPILARVQHALAALYAWNDAITHARQMEALAHQPGRYEYDLRYTMAGGELRRRLAAAERTLEAFERHAPSHGVDAAAVYVELGGRPALVGEGETVAGWRRH